MAFDFLKKAVKEYSEKNTELDEENRMMQEELAKADDLVSSVSGMDSEIVQGAFDIRNSFDPHIDELNERAQELQEEKSDILSDISSEQEKLKETKSKLNSIKDNPYASHLEAASAKGDQLMGELESLLDEIDEDIPDISSGSDQGISAGSSGKKGGLFSGLFSKKAEPASVSQAPHFGSFEMAQIPGSSDYFVKGSNYDSFISDYNNYGSTVYQSLSGNEKEAVISPSLIEGIRMGPGEAADNSIFWAQHLTGGTKESFMEITSHIPQVRSLIDSGMSLDEIRHARPDLEECVSIYFSPSQIPWVIQCDGYYELDSGGRHRVLTAREAGYDIPVRIVGIRHRK